MIEIHTVKQRKKNKYEKEKLKIKSKLSKHKKKNKNKNKNKIDELSDGYTSSSSDSSVKSDEQVIYSAISGHKIKKKIKKTRKDKQNDISRQSLRSFLNNTL